MRMPRVVTGVVAGLVAAVLPMTTANATESTSMATMTEVRSADAQSNSAKMDAATQTAPVRSAVTQATADAECPAPDAGPADPAESAEMVQLDQAASEAAASRVEVLSEEAGITPHTPAAFVNREGVKAYAIDADGVQATSVTFPIEGDRFTQPSNLTFILDEAGNLTQYSESTVVEREDGILDVATYRDGVLVHTAEFDPAAPATNAPTAAADTTSCLMVVLGVSAATAGLILILCGGSCSVPVTPPTATICAACIGGIAVVGGASITAVMGCF
jgi:hypothetical protein